MKPTRSTAWLLVATCLLCAASARARDTYPPLLPNRATAFSDNEGKDRPCITCHNNPDGGQGCVDSGGTPPCFNPFGQGFSDNQKVWSPTLAALDSDGDGFTNGQELQDPSGQWVFGQASPGNAAYVTRPGFSSFGPDNKNYSPGLNDGDDDYVCWFGHDVNHDGDCVDPGEQTGADCNDAVPTINSQVPELCTDAVDNDCDGLPTLTDPDCAQVIDNDADGFCETGRDTNADRDCVDANEPSQTEVDCDDTRATVYHGAPENCIDTRDNDCNGDVDFDDAQCDGNDDDGDGYCPIGQDIDHSGTCDETEVSSPGDCYDVPESVDPISRDVNPLATEVCSDGRDNDCNGHADFTDPACAQLVDSDGDGYCPQGRDLNGDGNCAGAGEDTTDQDCDDLSEARSPSNTELCYDGIDRDCDQLIGLDDPSCDAFRDEDNDGFCGIGQDVDGDHSCLSENPRQLEILEYSANNPFDCNDGSPIAFQRNPGDEELDADFSGCFDGLDTDCDGEADAGDYDCVDYADTDRDGFCVYGVDGDTDGDGVADAAKDGDCTDPGEAKPRTAVLDCKEGNAAISPVAPENCVDVFNGNAVDNNCDGLANKQDPQCIRDVPGDPTDYPGDDDVDGDGYCPLGTDLNGNGSCKDPGENLGNDCNDGSAQVHSGAAEDSVALCKDATDNDCDGLADAADTDADDCGRFLDQDRDGFCPTGTDTNFNGRCLESDEQTAARDCDDGTAVAFPGRREICDDLYDNDCNGKADALDSEVCQCAEDLDCQISDPCVMGVCVNRHCAEEPVAECLDAGMPEADAGMGHEHEHDAGSEHEHPPHHHVDAGVDDGPPPPKPSDCTLHAAASRRGQLGWLLFSAALVGLALRRRSKG